MNSDTEYSKCPVCGEKTTLLEKEETERFLYGVGKDAAKLSVVVPVVSCSECKFEFTDYRAEEIKDIAIESHLSLMESFGETERVLIRKCLNLDRDAPTLMYFGRIVAKLYRFLVTDDPGWRVRLVIEEKRQIEESERDTGDRRKEALPVHKLVVKMVDLLDKKANKKIEKMVNTLYEGSQNERNEETQGGE